MKSPPRGTNLALGTRTVKHRRILTRSDVGTEFFIRPFISAAISLHKSVLALSAPTSLRRQSPCLEPELSMLTTLL